jgi:hypothetical protein
MGVEPRGFEPLTSAVQRRLDSLQDLPTGFKITAKSIVSALMLFPSFQVIVSCCCTVAAQVLRTTPRMSNRTCFMV